MFVIGVLIQTVWLVVAGADVRVIVLFGVTVIVPVAVTVPQPPVRVIVYGNEPETDGVPVIVYAPPTKLPVTPVGRPVIVAVVVPVTAKVISVIGVLIHKVWLVMASADVNVIVLFGVTVMVPVAMIVPQPPVRLIV